MIDITDHEVPDDVRQRITMTIRRGVAVEDRHRRRAPFAVAAGVVALVAAAVATTLALHRGSEPVVAIPPPAPPTSPSSTPPTGEQPSPAQTQQQELDRCWQAVVHAGKQDRYPARTRWVAATRRATTGENVTGVRADGKVFFCAVTKTRVTVTDPNAKVTAAHGTSVRVLLVDDMGFIAGTVDPGKDVDITVPDEAGYGIPSQNGMFVIHGPARPDLAAIAVVARGGSFGSGSPIPPVPAPAVAVVDRPLPPPDRTSAEGARLGACMAHSGSPKSYADQWQPGAVARHGDAYVQVGVNGDTYGVCERIDGKSTFSAAYTNLPADGQPTYIHPSKETYFPTSLDVALGTVPATATAMTVQTADGVQHPASVRDGTWASELTVDATPAGTIASVTVRDVHGTVIYTGPVLPR